MSPAHEDGRAKAQFFTRFGFGIDDWETLAVAFKRHAGEHDVEKIAPSSYGIRYIVVGALSTPDNRNPMVKVVWFVPEGQAEARNGLSGKEEGNMIRELDRVVLNDDFPEEGLRAGDIGTVVLVHQGLKGFEVEFVALDGETIAVVTADAGQLRGVKEREIARIRSVDLPLAA